MIYTIIGFLAIGIMNGSAIPQILKLFRTHRVKDLHMGRDIMLLTGCILYLIYAIHRKDPVVIVSNIWGISMFLILIWQQCKYKK